MLSRDGRGSNFGEDGESGRPHTLAIIPASIVLEFLRHKESITLIQMNCIEFNSQDLGSLH
jgi:hypothetical protein